MNPYTLVTRSLQQEEIHRAAAQRRPSLNVVGEGRPLARRRSSGGVDAASHIKGSMDK